MHIAFIGLGTMGAPMARHLAAAGHHLTVYNRTAAKARAWADANGGRVAATPAEAAAGADALLTCVGADRDLAEVLLGKRGAVAALPAGSLLIDHSTVSASISREIAAAARARDIDFLDAPVSGGQAGAEAGQLTIMVGGDAAAFARAEPILSAYSRRAGLMGPSGCGQLTKMVNQVAVAGLLQGLAEAVNFCLDAGLEPKAVFDVIGKGAAQSWQMDNRALSMAEGRFDFGFAVEWMRKDLGLVLDEAKRLGASMPVTALVDQFYADVERMGGRRQDTSSLIRRLRSA